MAENFKCPSCGCEEYSNELFIEEGREIGKVKVCDNLDCAWWGD